MIVDRIVRVYGFAPITSVASRAVHDDAAIPSKPGQAHEETDCASILPALPDRGFMVETSALGRHPAIGFLVDLAGLEPASETSNRHFIQQYRVPTTTRPCRCHPRRSARWRSLAFLTGNLRDRRRVEGRGEFENGRPPGPSCAGCWGAVKQAWTQESGVRVFDASQRHGHKQKARRLGRALEFRRIRGRTPTVPESCLLSLTHVKRPRNMIQNRRQQATDFVQSPVIRGSGLRHSERAELV